MTDYFTTPPALGFLELNSISRGLYLTDLILKKAPVRIVVSQPISAGKHIILFKGEVAEVEESYQEATTFGDNTILRQVLIPGVHAKLAPFLTSPLHLDGGAGITAAQVAPASAAEATSIQSGLNSMTIPTDSSVGIVESASLAGAVLAADRALKMTEADLYRLRLGQGIGGKAYFVMTGAQDEVEASLEAARNCLQELDSFIRVDLIARPIDEVLEHF